MKIMVCIKQVPGANSVEVDPVTGVLKRDGIEAKMNPYDQYALELAFNIKQQLGGTVDVISMGPIQAKNVLLEAVYMGADTGTLLSDRRFAGADVVATSYTLSQGIRKLGEYDLILCGKQTTDGDTAQVGPEIAEFLCLEHAANILKVIDITNESVTVEINMDDYSQIQKMKLPCLLTVEKGINTPRLPSYKRKIMVKEDRIRTYTLDDFTDKNIYHYGLSGSPTQVERIFPPEKNKEREIKEGTGEELSKELFVFLRRQKFV